MSRSFAGVTAAAGPRVRAALGDVTNVMAGAVRAAAKVSVAARVRVIPLMPTHSHATCGCFGDAVTHRRRATAALAMGQVGVRGVMGHLQFQFVSCLVPANVSPPAVIAADVPVALDGSVTVDYRIIDVVLTIVSAAMPW